jgi:hypothetical protein
MLTRLILSIGALALLAGCLTSAQEACQAQGYVEGTGEYNACVRAEEQAIVQRIKARRGGGHGYGNQGAGG